jgi:hypothetical protein
MWETEVEGKGWGRRLCDVMCSGPHHLSPYTSLLFLHAVPPSPLLHEPRSLLSLSPSPFLSIDATNTHTHTHIHKTSDATADVNTGAFFSLLFVGRTPRQRLRTFLSQQRTHRHRHTHIRACAALFLSHALVALHFFQIRPHTNGSRRGPPPPPYTHTHTRTPLFTDYILQTHPSPFTARRSKTSHTPTRTHDTLHPSLLDSPSPCCFHYSFFVFLLSVFRYHLRSTFTTFFFTSFFALLPRYRSLQESPNSRRTAATLSQVVSRVIRIAAPVFFFFRGI